MHIFDPAVATQILATYGYYAIFLVVMLESAGIPMPGETILVSASIYASTRAGLDIRYVILAAGCGAIVGDNIGYWIGRAFGPRILARFGPRIGLDARKQKLGQYLFKRYGGAIVFFGRFAALLRTYAALLAGINRLLPGQGIERVAGPIGYAALACALVGAVIVWRFYKKNERDLLDLAEREMDPAKVEVRA